MSSQPEPEWDEREQDWMLALSEYEAGLCPNCGRPMSVCTDPKNEFRFKTGLPTRCHATTARLIAQDAVKDPHHGGALMYFTTLNEG